MYKAYIPTENSPYKVYQNPLKGNSFTDFIAFKTIEERDAFINKFLGFDYRNKLVENKTLSKAINQKDDANISFDLDLTRDTEFGLDKQSALNADWLILEDTNQKVDSPNRIKFYSINSSLSSKQNYTKLHFNGELDWTLTYPTETLFKKGAKIRLNRGFSNQPIGYGSEMSYPENFDDMKDIMVFDNDYIGNISLKDEEVQFPGNWLCIVIDWTNAQQFNTTPDANGNTIWMKNFYYKLKRYDLGEKPITNGTPEIDVSDGDNIVKKLRLGLGVKDYQNSEFSFLMHKPYLCLWFQADDFLKSNNFPNEFFSSEYVLAAWTTPFLPNENELVKTDYYAMDEVSVGGLYGISNLGLMTGREMAIKSDKWADDLQMEELFLRTPMNKDEIDYDIYNKLFTSQFRMTTLDIASSTYELKPEMWNWQNWKEGKTTFIPKIVSNPTTLNAVLNFENAPYYDSKDLFEKFRAYHISIQSRIPTITNGSQSTFQNFNSFNLTNQQNQRDKKFQQGQGGLSIVTGLMKAVFGGILGNMLGGGKGGMLGAYAGLASGTSTAMTGIQQEMSANDKINDEAAKLRDSQNNPGMFTDGTKDGTEMLFSFPQFHLYKVAEPIYKQINDYFKMYGYNLGGALYDINKKIEVRDKYFYIQSSDDIGNIYQALGEWISPNVSKNIALSIQQGIRGWWANNFTFIGDYDSKNNIILDDGTKIDDVYHIDE